METQAPVDSPPCGLPILEKLPWLIWSISTLLQLKSDTYHLSAPFQGKCLFSTLRLFSASHCPQHKPWWDSQTHKALHCTHVQLWVHMESVPQSLQNASKSSCYEQRPRQITGVVEESQNQSSEKVDAEKLKLAIWSYQLLFPLQNFHHDPKVLSSQPLYASLIAAGLSARTSGLEVLLVPGHNAASHHHNQESWWTSKFQHSCTWSASCSVLECIALHQYVNREQQALRVLPVHHLHWQLHRFSHWNTNPMKWLATHGAAKNWGLFCADLGVPYSSRKQDTRADMACVSSCGLPQLQGLSVALQPECCLPFSDSHQWQQLQVHVQLQLHVCPKLQVCAPTVLICYLTDSPEGMNMQPSAHW